MNDVEVVYTMWANLKKTPAMDVGQVGFYKENEVRKIKVAKRSNEIVNRLEKTKKQENPGTFLVVSEIFLTNCFVFV